MKARFLLALLLLLPLAACGRSPVRLETRTFALHYLQGDEAQEILTPYVFGDRPGARGTLSFSRFSQSTVTVRETPDNLDRIARVLARFDRPAPIVRLTFKLIRADGATRRDSSIREVEDALRSLFRFQGYSLVTEGIITGSPQSTTRQTLAGAGGPYSLEAGIVRIGTAGDSAVVTLHVRLMFRGAEFSTTVGIPAGRSAVLGNVQGGSPTSALILTVRPEFVAN